MEIVNFPSCGFFSAMASETSRQYFAKYIYYVYNQHNLEFFKIKWPEIQNAFLHSFMPNIFFRLKIIFFIDPNEMLSSNNIIVCILLRLVLRLTVLDLL